MRILLDECLPRKLKALLSGCECSTAWVEAIAHCQFGQRLFNQRLGSQWSGMA